MSTSPSGTDGGKAWKWALYGAIEAAVIGAAVTALITGLLLRWDNWFQWAGRAALIAAMGGGIGGALFGGRRPPS